MRKIIILFIFVLFISTLLFSSSITRGPEVGEIYYIGETATGKGIYHSTDFGETATCMDSTLNTNINFGSITADLTPGVLYGYSSPENLYISYDYGQEGSWIFRSNDYHGGNSGRSEGHLYCDISRHSEDYGNNFINHSLNGYFGLLKTPEVDNDNEVAYAIVYEWSVSDTLWLLISYDNYENLEIQHIFNFGAPSVTLTRGYEEGELYLYTYYWGVGDGRKLRYSNDYGETWELKNTFNCPNLPIRGLEGGRQQGEIFMLVEYVQLMHTIQHTYIYHSTDYGETFTIYNPFSFGPEPYFANFIATPTEGEAPLSVQFTDISSGENNQEWQWDFDGDGEIDSYEQNPEFTYQESGTFQVSLTIFWTGQSEMTATQEIIVTDSVGTENNELGFTNYKLSNYPNPFNPTTTIELTAKDAKNAKIEIYNLKGQKVKTLLDCYMSPGRSEMIWNGRDDNGKRVSSGVYFYQLQTSSQKFIKKMILLR